MLGLLAVYAWIAAQLAIGIPLAARMKGQTIREWWRS